MADETFQNEPSDLDDLSHAELRLMHEAASDAILFTKFVQWLAVGTAFFIYMSTVAIAAAATTKRALEDILTGLDIMVACGAIFVLFMYQMWQTNEIRRIILIERRYSTIYAKIRSLAPRRNGKLDRYTMMLFMITVVVVGAAMSIASIRALY